MTDKQQAETIVVNLFGGANKAKTTVAWGVGYHLKMLGVRTELAPEYIKPWTYEGRTVGDFHQMYIFGKQTHYESRYYNKAHVVVAECPVLLGGFYESYYMKGESKVSTIGSMEFMAMGRARGVTYHNYWLDTKVPFDGVGRFGNEEQNAKMHQELRRYLDNLGVQLIPCNSDVPNIVDQIVSRTSHHLNVQKTSMENVK